MDKTPAATDLVTFDLEWYTMTNMAMLIFSATLMVHISNAYRSFQLYRKFPNNKCFIANVFESFSGVACHLCRVSDYFFATDCHFKGYFNGVFYYISTALATSIMGYRCFSVTPLRHVYGMLTILLQVVKLGGIVMFTLTLKSMVGKFSDCVALPDGVAFKILMLSEITLNLFMLTWWTVLVSIRIYQQPSKIAKAFEDGAGYTMFSAVATLVLFTCVYNNFVFGLNPEVLLQTKWAIESKMCVAQLEALAKDLKGGKKSEDSRVHSLSPGWTWASSKKTSHESSANRHLNSASA